MRTRMLFAAGALLALSTAALAQNRPPNAPLTQAQRQATLQGVAAGRQAAAQSRTEAAAALNNAYNTAKVADAVAKEAAGKIVPSGSAAYSAGKALGTYVETHPVTVQQSPAPLPHYGYTPPPVSVQTCKNFPSLPNCGSTKGP